MRLLPRWLLLAALAASADAETRLVGLESTCRYLVPGEANGGAGLALSEWTAAYEGFDDSAWPIGQFGIGYGSNSEIWLPYFYWDVFDVMRYINATLYLRAPFELGAGQLERLKQLVLEVRVDDGFVAFLNGTEAARFNAPAELRWDSRAIAAHPDSEAALPLPFDLSEHLGSLVEGTNILAIQLLNNTPNSQDVFILPELWADETEPGDIAHPRSLSVLSIDRREDGFPGTIRVGVARGRFYQLQTSIDLRRWSDVGHRVVARGTELDFRVGGSFFGPRYYRVAELAP